MLSSISENRSRWLSSLSPLSAGDDPAEQARPSEEPETDAELLIQDQLDMDERQAHIETLIKHSMEAELFQTERARAENNKIAAGLIRGTVKQAYGFAILQEQQNLLGFPRTVGYG